MLLEKIRVYGSPKINNSKGSNKSENYLGPKVLKWFGKDLAKVAANYDILDDENRPQSWTTADISDTIKNNPEYEKTLVAAFLDKTSARQVTSQISMLSKLRAILLQHNNNKDFPRKLQRAIKQSKRADDDWKKPDWWSDATEEHSFILLMTLNQMGFGKIMTNPWAKGGFGAPGVNYSDMDDLGFTKASMQIRANQLVRELYAIEDHDNMLQMVAKRRNKLNAKNSMSIDSLAVAGSSKNPSPKNGSSTEKNKKSTAATPKSGKKTTVQTGLKAFFSSTPSSNGKKKTGSGSGSSPESDGSTSSSSSGKNNNNKPSPPSNGTKRKESPLPPGKATSSGSGGDDVDATGSPPAEKKHKTGGAEVVEVVEMTEPTGMEIEEPKRKAADVVVID